MANYWIYTSERRDPIALTGVTEIRRVKCRVPNGKYRDGANFPFGTADGTASTASLTDIPIRGTSTLTGAANVATSAAALVSDEALNIAPRQDWRVDAGYAVAIGGAVPRSSRPFVDRSYFGRAIPSTISVTVNATTNLVSPSTAHTFITGDVALLSWTTKPSGVTDGKLYTFVGHGATDFYLLEYDTQRPVVWGSAGAGLTITLVEPAPRITLSTQTVTSDLAADSFSTGASSYSFVSGDIVRFSGSVPTGITVNTLYRVVYLTFNTFSVEDISTNALIALSGTAHSPLCTLVTPVDRSSDFIVDLDNAPNVLFFPDSVVSLVSNVDPNA